MTMPGTFGVLDDPGVAIPGGIAFASLKLQQSAEGTVRFDRDVLLQVWEASGFPAELLDATDSAEVCRFIARWYGEHMRMGGRADPLHAWLVSFLLGRKPAALRIQPLDPESQA